MAETRRWLRSYGSSSDSLAQDIQPNDESLVASFARTSKLSAEQDNARYVRLVRFSFLILIGRFVTLEP
jgi:hypothetical protein